MRSRLLIIAVLVFSGFSVFAESKAERKFPGMVLEEGQTMADLGRGERVSRPAPLALAALESDDYLDIVVGDNIVFTPKQQTYEVGMVFYHGAETDPRVYARPLRAIAEQGYLVVAVTMPRYLAVIKPNKADEVIAGYPQISTWAIAGHSMGGAMAAQYVVQHPGKMSGLMFWDAYPSADINLKDADVIVAQIYRTDKKGKAPENFREVQNLLPESTMDFPIAGAAHTYFGDYILASHRPAPNANISLEEQMAAVIELSLEFMAVVSNSQK